MSNNFDNNSNNSTKRFRKHDITTQRENLGKLPPQALDLEEIVLGACLIEKDAYQEIADILKPDSFYKDANRLVFQAVQNLAIRSEPVDIATVTSELRKMGNLEMVGGAFYVTELTARVTSSANIEFHSRIISQKYVQRELIRISTETIHDCYNDTSDVFDLLSKTEFQKDEILQTLSSKKEITNGELLKTTLQEMERKTVSGITGVPSGFTELDRLTGGWQNSDLIIFAARPAMGKTSLAIQAVRNAAFDHKIPTAVFSLEMSSSQLMKKELAIECDIPLERFRKNQLTDEDWQKVHKETINIDQAPIIWDDTPSINIIELCAKARRLKRKHDIGFIVIDYLQLIHGITNGKSGNREQEIGGISRALKGLAKELDIPVLALSQLSRAVEQRPSKRPMLSDLRESGSIEQDADLVMFLYRAEYYGITEDEEGGSTDGIAEVILAKHRHGETGDIPLKFIKYTTGFKDLDLNFGVEPFSFQSPGYVEPSEGFRPMTIQPNGDFESDTEVPF